MPAAACRAVRGLAPGWKPLTVLIGIVRPSTETLVRFTVSGLETRRFPREASILPRTLVPARSAVFPFTATSWSSCALKVLPTFSCEEIASTVRTTRVVPAGIVAAKEAAIQAQLEIAIRINVFLVIFRFLELLVTNVAAKTE